MERTNLPHLVDQFLLDLEAEVQGRDTGAFPDGLTHDQATDAVYELLDRAIALALLVNQMQEE